MKETELQTQITVRRSTHGITFQSTGYTRAISDIGLPSAIPVTTPFTTVATDSSEDDHVTVLSVASSGVTVAVKASLSPTFMVADVLSKRIPSANFSELSAINVPEVDSKGTDSASSSKTLPGSLFCHFENQLTVVNACNSVFEFES